MSINKHPLGYSYNTDTCELVAIPSEPADFDPQDLLTFLAQQWQLSKAAKTHWKELSVKTSQETYFFVYDFLKEHNATAQDEPIYIKASLRPYVDASTVQADDVIELNVLRDPIFDGLLSIENSKDLFSETKKIVASFLKNKTEKAVNLVGFSPKYDTLRSVLSATFNAKQVVILFDGTASVSGVSAKYFKDINKLRSLLPDAGKGVTFKDLSAQISFEDILSATELTDLIGKYTPPEQKEFKIAKDTTQTVVPQETPVVVETPQPARVLNLNPIKAKATQKDAITQATEPIVEPTLVVKTAEREKTSNTAYNSDSMLKPIVNEADLSKEAATGVELLPVKADTHVTEVSVLAKTKIEDSPKEELKPIVPAKVEAEKVAVVKSKEKQQETKQVKNTPANKKDKPINKGKKYNSLLPFGRVIAFLKDNGMPLTANELKKEIPVPVLNSLNEVLNDVHPYISIVNRFLSKRANELGIEKGLIDLIDAVVIYTRSISPKILDDEIVFGHGVDFCTISEIRALTKGD